jgi:transcriptional regulator with XRE-family HTH domain
LARGVQRQAGLYGFGITALSVSLDRTAEHVARRLTARRAELRLSLAEVSSRCGVSLQQVHRYEVGLNTISAPMLWQLSKCLGVNITYFFEGLDENEGLEERA